MRPASKIMTPERLGASRTTSVSFGRSMLRKVMREAWEIQPIRFELNDLGFGEACYSVKTPQDTYYFVVFSHRLEDQERSDRVIADKWDVTFALCEGPLTFEKWERLRQGLPKQEAGRGDSMDLVWSRANRSTRMFDYIVEQLENERQPDPKILAQTGYLLRTTAVYGNGKFGIAPFEKMDRNHSFYGSFRAQMFAVYMLRHFSFELVEHIAKTRNPSAAKLHPECKRYLGIGNATGLGMVPYLIAHPQVLHTWITMKETALARVKQTDATPSDGARLLRLLDRSIAYFQQSPLPNLEAFTQPDELARELHQMRQFVSEYCQNGTINRQVPDKPWLRLCELAEETTGFETQEVINTLLLELYPDLVLDLEDATTVTETYDLVPDMSMKEVRQILETAYCWAFQFDFTDPDERKYFWYRSAEKEEPRMGVRGEEPGEEYELPVGIAQQVQALSRTLDGVSPDEKVAAFVVRYPEHKWIIRRMQSLQGCEYGEIHGNLWGSRLLPLHLLRLKLSFFGAERFDPQSNRWVRVTLFQGAPLVEEIGKKYEDDWLFPLIPQLEEHT
ncbi:hypothetical protein ACI7RC_13825 [Brevibacillus sp. B_LB10_24]|uniref:hypothetical protein n=1 Tax=Brevibacillus sp. B_LB10_24 TaxID=3380645 RepID=UPI0038BC8D4C